jgi:tRNA(Ile)-lysidine synthase
MRDKLGVRLHLVHLDHMLRGAESQADARYVSRLARDLGIPATIEQQDVKGYSLLHHCSVEEAAREVRYSLFAQVAGEVGGNRVAVGHTKDDQVETILMHLVRGTGSTGLRGMQPVTTWRPPHHKAQLTVVRPILEISREEARTYCHLHRLAPRSDSSNLSLSYLRNKIRHQLLPSLRDYNINIDDTLLRTASIAADDTDFFKEQVSKIWENVVREQEEALVLDSKKFALLHPALQRHFLREVLKRLLGNLKDIEQRHINGLMNALSMPAGKSLSLPGGLVFFTSYDRYIIAPAARVPCPFPTLCKEWQLATLGETDIPGWQVKATITQNPTTECDNNWEANFDLALVGDQLTVRKRRPGDRFQPLGMNQPKKLQDFMVDAKIPRLWRDRIPLVCSPQHIIWVAGWRIDDRAKVKGDTETALHLKFDRSALEG